MRASSGHRTLASSFLAPASWGSVVAVSLSVPALSPEHLAELRAARHALEHPGLAVRIANAIGSPIERTVGRLPRSWQEGIVGISRDALERAARAAIWTIDGRAPRDARDGLHTLAVSLTGAVGGAFGLPALALELPISTTIMLRSIAEIARGEGEDLATPGAKLACVEVFALGGRTRSDDASESAYYLARTALGKAVSDAAEYLARGGAKLAEPALVRFVTTVAARFQIQVTEKAAAQAVPVVGAAGGALINNLFISHFQRMARGHFTVRRLERVYSPEIVAAAYREP